MQKHFDKSEVSQAIISKIRNERTLKEIKAVHLEEFETPEKISMNSSTETFVPDIEVVYEKENIVYEIELNGNVRMNKWHAFSEYVRKSKGRFYLVVPKQIKELVQNILQENAVNAGVITFGTQAG